MSFLVLAVIATDWARLLYYTITVEQAARCGALYAADEASQPESRFYNVNETTAVENIVRAETAGINQSQILVFVLCSTTSTRSRGCGT